jgi:predicted enzyme related to lactoylglutathione lyase
MSRVVHFEIQAENPERAVNFYRDVFGWVVEDWSDFAGVPYFGVKTGESDAMGIDGAIMKRPGANPEVGGMVAGAVITVGIEDFDRTAQSILEAGGSIALPKYALPGMAWQGYFHDTENNVFGIHQPDANAA